MWILARPPFYHAPGAAAAGIKKKPINPAPGGHDIHMTSAYVIDPDQFARKRLNGRRATNRQFAQTVAKLARGEPRKGIPPMPQTQIAAALGYRDPKTIRLYLKLAAQLDEVVNMAPADRAQWKFENSTVAFNQDPHIVAWVQAMQTRQRGGQKLKTWKYLLRSFEIICKTTKTAPIQWITGPTTEDILENGRKLMAEFMGEYMAGRAAVKYTKNWGPDKVNPVSVAYHYAKGVRDFMRSNGYQYPEGESSSMSQSIAPLHGNYDDVRISPAQYELGKREIEKRHGTDSDIFRWFGLGIESMGRAGAIRGMSSNYEILNTKSGKTYYIMKAFESKTEHHKKGIWTKYIYSADLQGSISAVEKRSKTAIENNTERNIDQVIYPALRSIYQFLKLDGLNLRDPRDPKSGYFMEHPSHSLRHAGAQLWLRRTNWNIEFVARMGWKKAQELIDSYGAMPPEIQVEVLDQA